MSTTLQPDSNASVHLDAIRGAAALVVFLGHERPLFLSDRLASIVASPSSGESSHSATTAPQTTTPAAPRTTVGHEAVVVFFVLSGYFVGGSVIRAMRGEFRWKQYLLYRLPRLWVVLIPALLLGLAVDGIGMHLLGATPGSLYSGPPGALVAPGLAARLSLSSFLGNVLFLQQTAVEPFGTNVALWSIACEFWFYVFFPLLLTALKPQFAIGERILSGVVFVAAMLACGPHVAEYFPLWLAGCVVAVLPLRIPAAAQRWVTPALSAALLITCVCCLALHLNLFIADVWICIVFAVLLWAILHNPRTRLNPLYARGAKSLARMSYTLYATHLPLLVFGCALLSPVWHPQHMSAQVLAQMLVVDGVVFLCAVGMYELFERNTEKVRDWLRRSLGGQLRTPPRDQGTPPVAPHSIRNLA